MTRTPIPELAEAYLAIPAGQRGADWASDEVHNRLFDRSNAADAWELVQCLVAKASDDDLGNVAAGPLEDFVRRHAEPTLGAIERLAHDDERFRWALGCIWLNHGDLPADVLERLVAASDGRIRPL